MFLLGTTHQDGSTQAIPGSTNQANENQSGVFPLSQIDNAVPPFADPPTLKERLTPPPPSRKDSFPRSEGSNFRTNDPGDSENVVDSEHTEELSEQESSPGFNIAEAPSLQWPARLDKSSPEQKTETNFVVNQMNNSKPQSKREVDLNIGASQNPGEQNGLASPAPNVEHKQESVRENPTESPQQIARTEMEMKDKSNLAAERPPSQIESAASDAEQTTTEIVGQSPRDRGSSTTQSSTSGLEFLTWLIPCLVFLALLITILRAYRRRNEQIVKVDTSKPVRGAFRKRESVVESKIPTDDLAAGPSAKRDEVLESSDSDFDFLAEDESDAGYDFDAEPAETDLAAMKQVEASHFQDDQRNILSEQESDEAYDSDCETEDTESVFSGASSDERNDAIGQQVDFSEDDSLAQEVAPQSAWFSDSIAEQVEETIEAGAADSLTNVIAAGGLAPTASHERNAKSGGFSLWFKRKSEEVETMQKNEPPTVSTQHNIGNFQLADEDLRSLFSKAKPSDFPAILQNESDKYDNSLSDIQDEHSSISVPSNDHLALTAKLQAENSAKAAQLAAARAELETFSLQQSYQLEEHRSEQQVRASEMDEQRSLIKQLQGQLSEVIADRDPLREKLQGELSEVIADRAQLREKLQSELEELKAEKNTLLSKFDSAQSEGNHLVTMISELETFSLQQKHQLDEYLLELHARAKEAEEQRSSINRLQHELTEAVADRDQLNAKLDNLSSAKEKIEEQFTVRLQETRQQLNESIAELQGNLTAATSHRDQLQEELLQAKGAREQLQEELLQANGARESWAQLQDDLRTELEELAAEEELLSKLETAQDENGNLITKASELELHITQLREQLEQASNSSLTAGNGDGAEVISRATKEKFTRLYRSYERERSLRKEAEQFLTKAEEQIVQLRNKNRKKGK